MKKLILLITILPIMVLSQKSVMEFTPVQRAVLHNYLKKNPSVYFTSEKYLYDSDPYYKKIVDEHIQKNMKPYYNFNDFNGDGKKDFAVLLSKRGGKQVLLIFNNVNNKYKLAHQEVFDEHPAAFIHKSWRWNDNNLYYGVLETGIAICFRPAGEGYISEYCGGC